MGLAIRYLRHFKDMQKVLPHIESGQMSLDMEELPPDLDVAVSNAMPSVKQQSTEVQLLRGQVRELQATNLRLVEENNDLKAIEASLQSRVTELMKEQTQSGESMAQMKARNVS